MAETNEEDLRRNREHDREFYRQHSAVSIASCMV